MSSSNGNSEVITADTSQALFSGAAGGESLAPQESTVPAEVPAGVPVGEAAGTELASYGTRSGEHGAEKRATSERRRAASQANGRRSRGPVTAKGKWRSSQNARKPLERLLGLTEARTLRYQPGAALKLYRKLIAPYEPAPALLARHVEDLARLCLELEAMESIRDATLDHRAQQNTIEVRTSYREMDAELGVPPKEVFERGLHDLPDNPAKLKAQLDGLDALKDNIARGEFHKMGPTLRLLYGNELNPKSQQAKLVCIDCQRLMDPEDGEALSDEELSELVSMIEREEQWAMSGYELELDRRTVTGSASIARLAPRRRDQWMYLQVERLRRAIDRKQWVITGLLQTPALADRYGPNSAGVGQAGVQDPSPLGIAPKRKTNLRSTLESTKPPKNEPKTNLNEPKSNPRRRGAAHPKPFRISKPSGIGKKRT
jgi:hypothetical protein